jgi:transposase-like protein
MICRSWISHGDGLCGFFKYPPEIRRAIYTANAVGALNYRLRKVTRNRPAFAGDDAIFRILYLAVRNASRRRTTPVRLWGTALNRFAVIFGNERVPFK